MPTPTEISIQYLNPQTQADYDKAAQLATAIQAYADSQGTGLSGDKTTLSNKLIAARQGAQNAKAAGDQIVQAIKDRNEANARAAMTTLASALQSISTAVN